MDSRITQLVRNSDARLGRLGPDSDVVFSSRIRLARNLSGYSFVSRLSVFDREEILREAREVSEKIFPPESCYFFNAPELSESDFLCLLERQLVSREFIEGDKERAVLVDRAENFSIMFLEEDHLRIQMITAGFDLDSLWPRASELDNQFDRLLPYAYDEKRGYLTACPSNLGTGARLSVMLHLPALMLTNEIERAYRAMQNMNLSVRGLYGEGSKPFGSFFQVSNQTTLGMAEEEIQHHLQTVVSKIVEYERKARQRLLEKENERTLDRVCRAIGLLRCAHTIPVEEAMAHLSAMRMGTWLGLQNEIPAEKIDALFLRIQPAHLEILAGHPLDEDEAPRFRAEYLRGQLK